MPDVGAEEHAGDVVVVGLEGGDGDEGGDVAVLNHTPNVNVALCGGERLAIPPIRTQPGKVQTGKRVRTRRMKRVRHTELFPAQSSVPSLATVTLATETSSSGIS